MSGNLCHVCRELSLRPDTFLQTGWRYPTSLVYQTTSELLGYDDDQTDVEKTRATRGNHYVEGERLHSGEQGGGEIFSGDGGIPHLISDDQLNQRLPAAPKKNIFDEDGGPQWTVPFKLRKLGSLDEVHNRAAAGCSLCLLTIHASTIIERRTAQDQAKTESGQINGKSQCKIRFDFKDIEHNIPNEETKLSQSNSSVGQAEQYVRPPSPTVAQENGHYESRIHVGSESVSVQPLFTEHESEFRWFGGRLIQSEVDYSLVERWLSSCDTLHPACSEEKHRIDISLVERLRVIDVVRGCLTEINVPGPKFVALSYVWGDAPTLKVTRQNLKQLQGPGSLEKLADQVPNTTRDAMQVVRKLDLQYLWTDSLCILQDDMQEMAPQLRRMDLIYAAAYFTIVAADGSSVAAGLAGTSSQRQRQAPVPVRYSDEMQLMLVPETLPDVLLHCPWSTRLWTLQEALMSRRLLLFTAHGMHFTCSSLSWSENLKAVSETQAPPWKHANENLFHFRATLTAEDPTPTATIGSMWDMELWMDMITESSERRLGYEWDIENATAGVARQLESFYRTTNLYGMPECVLMEFLSWSPMTSGGLRRRINAANERFHPTWSWSGWVGEVSWPGGDAQDDESEQCTQVSICKMSRTDAEPVSLASQELDAVRAPRESFPYLHISTRTTALRIDKGADAPESIKELQPFAWYVVLPQGVKKVGIYCASTRQTPTVPAGSVVFDSMDSCPIEEAFDCHFLQIYPVAQKLEVGRYAGQLFFNVLAIREIGVLDNGVVLAERIGHGRLLLSETRDMWTQRTFVLR